MKLIKKIKAFFAPPSYKQAPKIPARGYKWLAIHVDTATRMTGRYGIWR